MGIGHATTTRYICETCKRDLGSAYERAVGVRKGRKIPCVNITSDGRVLCDRCFYKQ